MAKLPNGTRKRANGTFEKRFTINGKRYSIYASNIKELADKENAIRQEIANGIYTPNARITLDEYFYAWIEQKKQTTKANTYRLYQSIYNNHIRQRLGNKKIKDIEKREITEIRTKLIGTLTANYINNIMLVLNMILSDAVKDEIITNNPAAIKALKTDKKATETIHRALDQGEQRVFMDTLKDNYYYHFIALMLATGMRIGEVSALTWEDIDTKANVIHVNKTLTFDENGKKAVGTTKSDAGKRDIPINATIKSILQEHKSKMNCLPFATNNVFVTPYNRTIYNETINKAISETINKVNANGQIHLDHFTSHALRDTFATRFIEQSGNMQILQKILGHSSITMTMDIYAHVLPDTKQTAMDNLQIVI